MYHRNSSNRLTSFRTVAIYSLSPFIGPVVGPVVSGYVQRPLLFWSPTHIRILQLHQPIHVVAMDILRPYHLGVRTNALALLDPRNVCSNVNKPESRKVRFFFSLGPSSVLAVELRQASDLGTGFALTWISIFDKQIHSRHRFASLLTAPFFLSDSNRIRAQTGDDRYYSPFEKKDRTMLQTIILSIIRPFCELTVPFCTA